MTEDTIYKRQVLETVQSYHRINRWAVVLVVVMVVSVAL